MIFIRGEQTIGFLVAGRMCAGACGVVAGFLVDWYVRCYGTGTGVEVTRGSRWVYGMGIVFTGYKIGLSSIWSYAGLRSRSS